MDKKIITDKMLLKQVNHCIKEKYKNNIYPCAVITVQELNQIIEKYSMSYDLNKVINKVEKYVDEKYGIKDKNISRLIKETKYPTVLDYLHSGSNNAVSLTYLADMLDMTERAVREEINRINTSGEEIICNDGNGKGYYIAATLDEAKSYRNYNRSYWESGIEKDKGIARCMERRFANEL